MVPMGQLDPKVLKVCQVPKVLLVIPDIPELLVLKV
jgi:hypothetical protein